MLFKTVYGPELECIWKFLRAYGPRERQKLLSIFVPLIDGKTGPTTNLEDALSFLVSCGLVKKNNDGRYEATEYENHFKLSLLSRLRALQLGQESPAHPLDPWYLGLLDSLFVKRDHPLVFGLHQLANSLDIPEILSEEKINAWRRVHEFIGLGHRLASGFLCVYRPALILDIVGCWEEEEGPMQTFLEEHVSQFLPWCSDSGSVSHSLRIPLEILAGEGHIRLEKKQDLPHKAYCGEVKWIRKGV